MEWWHRLDLQRIGEEERRRLLRYLVEKGVSHRELNIDRTYFWRLTHGKVKVSDPLLERMLSLLTEEEFRRLMRGEGTLEAYGLVRGGVVDYSLVLEILDYAKRDPFLKSLLARWASENLLPELPHTVYVKEEHLQRFEKLLSQRAKETRRLHRYYLKKALEALGREWSPEKLEDYMAEVLEYNVYAAQHTARALRFFIKNVLKDRQLLEAVKIPRPKSQKKPEAITQEEVVAVAKAIESPAAKAWFVLLAETGLRPHELLTVRLVDVDLEKRIINIYKVGETKRSYFTFLHESTAKWLEEYYLPYREEAVKRFGNGVRAVYGEEYYKMWSGKFLPFKEDTMRAEIRAAMKKALGRYFRLYALRSFFAATMIKAGVSPMIVNMLQGRAAPDEFEILQNHYLPFTEQDLREAYEKAAPRIAEQLYSSTTLE